MMKTNKFFLLAAAVCGAAFTSCSSIEDNPAAPKTATVTFENRALNANLFWIGDDATEPSYSYESYGSTYTVYNSTYVESNVTLPITYTKYVGEWGGGDFWSGFAISARTATDYASLTPDQYNNVTGKAHGGNQFCVVTTYGETITVPDAVVKGLWFTNSSYTANSILHGDSYSGGAFDATDWLKCTITGKTAQGTESSVEIDLAKDGDYVKTWQYCDLTSLGKVVELSFAFTGSRTGEYGLNTPAYICIDDIEISL